MNDTLKPSTHAYLRELAAEAQRVAQALHDSGNFDDSASDASEAADALVLYVGVMFAASDSDRRERAADLARDWRNEDRRAA